MTDDAVKELIFHMCLGTPCETELKYRIMQCYERNYFSATETQRLIKMYNLEEA